jgi:hypothetical protein
MIHEPFDSTYWKSFFSPARFRESTRMVISPPEMLSGSYDIAVLEQFRDLTYAHVPGVKRVPTDLFIWYRGEPQQRAVTKIGGLPYRAADILWPVGPSGIALTFVAQICFLDSLSIVPPLPGDILLIFTEPVRYRERGGTEIIYEFLGEDEEDSYLFFEWVSLTTHPLVSAQDVPQSGLRFMPCYGALHHTWDYPEIDGFAYPEIIDFIPPIGIATKIGGICPKGDNEVYETNGYFCSLSSLDNNISLPFPFLNVPEPITYEEWKRSDRLLVGDVWSINFFLNDDGTIRWRIHV